MILLELDFPRKKTLPAKLKAQNEELRAKFGVRGYPTILFLDAKGKEVGRGGYQKGGPANWIKYAEKLMK